MSTAHSAHAGRLLACLFLAASATVACGQKPGVYTEPLAQPAGGAATSAGQDSEAPASSVDDSDAGVPSGSAPDREAAVSLGGPEGSSAGNSAGNSVAGPGPADDPAGGSDTQTSRDRQPAGGGDSGSASAEGQSGTSEPRGQDRTGVADDVLTISLHAPITGAAPLPSTTFEQSRDLYWRYLESQGEKVVGRSRVEVLFKDDKYDPSSAMQACRELAAKSFLLLGAGGTDQIQACGRLADKSGVPYVSVGVTEAGLTGLPYYFALSMTYRQQGPLLAAFVGDNFGGRKIAAVVTDTPNFDDAVRGWEEGVQREGLDYYRTLRTPKGDNSWYTAFAGDLADAGVEVVYVNTSPVDYIRFAQQAAQQDYRPQFVGVGITMGLNAVLNAACEELDGGLFFSPFPGLDWARDNVPEFFETGRSRNAPTDDVAFGLWAIAAQEHELLRRYESVYGTDLTREDFRDLVERQQDVDTGIFPRASYSPDDHFGAQQVHVLEADCSAKEYRTFASFVSAF